MIMEYIYIFKVLIYCVKKSKSTSKIILNKNNNLRDD